MYKSFLNVTPGRLGVFVACILSLAILITPIAAISAASSVGNPTATENDFADPASQSNVFGQIVCDNAPVVTTNADSGTGSLRQAITDACNDATITFDMAQVVSPISIEGELVIDKNLTIQGPTTTGLTINGSNMSRIFNVNAGMNLTFSNLTISGGQAAAGGGVNNLGNLTILNSTLTGNTATSNGGAIFTEGGVVKIINSTISGNSAGSGGGGGLYNGGTSQTTITNSTIAANNEGIRHLSTSPLLLNNTIVARNPDCESCDEVDVFVDNIEVPTATIDPASSNNLIGVDTGVVGISNGTNGNQIGSGEAPVNPLLGALANNGGPTFTHALNDFSPAADTGSNALAVDQNNAALTTDQRGTGFPRILNGTVDIGAYEKTFVPPPPSADVGVMKHASNEEAVADQDVVYTITLTNAGPDAAANVALVDALPLDMTFVSLSQPAGWLCTTPAVGANGTVNCTNANLGVGGSPAFTLTAHIPPGAPGGTDYHNVATVSSPTSDPESLNNQAAANTTVVSCLTNPVVTTNAGSGTGSLRQAINDACDGSTISFDMNQVVSPITLTSGDLLINKNLTITGPGASLLTISANSASRVFNIASGVAVTISDLTIANGKTGVSNNGANVLNNGTLTLTSCNIYGGSSTNIGGGIFNGGPFLTLTNCNVGGIGAGQANSAFIYGGIYNSTGTLTINGGSISGNSSGGIYVEAGTANLTGVTITNNSFGAASGGGLGVGGGTVTLTNCLIANNNAGTGGGVSIVGGATTIANSTISTNNTSTCGGTGGGIRVGNGTLTLANATITNNRAGGSGGGGINQAGGTVILSNAIVAGNFDCGASTTPNDINGTIDASSSFNLIGTGGSGGLTNGVNNNQVGINALLDSLASNGGATATHALLPGSPAINTGSNATVVNPPFSGPPFTDQRGTGFERIVNTTVDIGAFESRGFTISATSGTPQSTAFNTAFSAPLVATVSSAFGEPVSGGQITFTAPGAGASATFTGGVITINAALNASGQASASATANAIVGGPYNVTASGSGVTGTANFSLTNTKANQTITFGALANKTFGDPDFIVSATASSGLTVSLSATGNCTVSSPSPGTVHLTGAGSCTITASQAGNVDYNPAPSVQQSFTINKGNQTITFGALANKTFGDPDFAVNATASSGLPVSFSATGNCTVTSPSPGTVHITGAGSCTITASQAGNVDYNAAPDVPRSFTINKANQTITFGSLANKTFGDPDFSVSATASSGLAVSFSATGSCTVTSSSPGTVHLNDAGSCTITASQAGNVAYNAAPDVPRSFTINKANQTITFGSLANKTFADPDFSVSATSSSGLTVSFSATGNCTVSSPSPGNVHLTGAGSCTITASQTGNIDYNAASDVQRSFNIAKAATSTAVSSSVNPSDFNQSVTFTATVTGPAGTGTPTGTVQFKDNAVNLGAPIALNAGGVAQFTTSSLTTGTHTITAEYSGNANFLASTGTLAGGQVVKTQPSLSIDDVSISEGNAGTTILNFTVTLSAASNLTVSVGYILSDGTAVSPGDYQATSGTLTFNPGATTQTVPVTINGDVSFEPDETLFVSLSNASNATISDNQGTGTIQNDDALGGFIGFSQVNTSVDESTGIVTLTVTRGFPSFGQANAADALEPANVDYATDDTGASTNCAALNTGLASQRCDYTSVFGTLKFAAGETQKTIDIPITLDAYNEGPEVFTVKLSNPTGGAVASPSTATVTINDSASPTPNAIDDTTTFVRQQYRDFLNREADPQGLAFWKDNIDKCNDPARRPANQTVAQCIEVQRIVTSAAFFLSIEFKQTGGLVRDFYVAALDRPATNNMPNFVEFMRDTQGIQKGVVVGQGNWQQVLDANRTAFMDDFVTRAEFVGLYPTTDTPTQYVDKLYLHAGVSPANPGERAAAIAEFGGASTAADPAARGRALLRVTQNAAFQAREANRAFVQMEYFGYLRRNPNDAPDGNFNGFNFWVNKLNQFNGDFLQAEMIKAFLSSPEYRSRFGH